MMAVEQIKVNRDNAELCVVKLHNYFSKNKIEELATVEYPKSILYGSEEWLYYIFYSCLLDYGMKSKIYHSNLINTYIKYPKIFNPRYVIEQFKTNEEKLLSIIKQNVHPRFPNVALKKWINLSTSLSLYDNLLFEIKKYNSFDEFASFIKGISGYGQKTGGLLLRLIVEANICSFDDDISFIPMDRHDIEISYLNGVINTDKLTQSHITELSNLWIASGKKCSISPDTIDKYLWEIGNRFCTLKKCISCPLYSNCKTKIEKEEKYYESNHN